jgi:hypothetical protein
MSNIVDRVFAEVCLDERVSDGIFRMEEEQHMNALRDYFLKKGIPKEAAVHVTNRMIEGQYPDRQAYRAEDGILVTFPSPGHKARAMAKAPGKYVNQDPRPESEQPQAQKEPPKEPKDRMKDISKDVPKDEPEDDDKLPKSDADNEGGNEKKSTIFQGDKELALEPPRGDEKPDVAPPPQSPTPPPAPRTPERIAAEKEVVRQIMATDDNALSNVANPMNEVLKIQLHELYKKADELGFREAVTFLTKYVKP